MSKKNPSTSSLQRNFKKALTYLNKNRVCNKISNKALVDHVVNTLFLYLDSDLEPGDPVLDDMDLLVELCSKNKGIMQAILSKKEIQGRIVEFQDLWLAHEQEFENRLVSYFLEGNKKPLRKHLERHYAVVRREGELVHLNDKSRVLVLGCGPFPITAVIYYQCFGSRCTCIDSNMNIVKTSRLLIRQLEFCETIMEGYIDIEYGDATNYPTDDFDLIIVTLHCTPKNLVFRNIIKSVSHAKVLYRAPVGLYCLFYPEVTNEDIKGFIVKIKNEADSSTMIQPVLLSKMPIT